MGKDANVPLARGLLSVLDLTRRSRDGAGTNPIVESAANAAAPRAPLSPRRQPRPSLVPCCLGKEERRPRRRSALASSPKPSSTIPSVIDVDENVETRLAGVVADGCIPNAAWLHACGSLLALRRAVVLRGRIGGSGSSGSSRRGCNRR